jgi:hypothetical protein
MFHAVVRTRGSVLHLLAELDPYDLETLRQHIVLALRENPPVHVAIGVEAHEPEELQGRLRRWARRLEGSGAAVEIGRLPIRKRNRSPPPGAGEQASQPKARNEPSERRTMMKRTLILALLGAALLSSPAAMAASKVTCKQIRHEMKAGKSQDEIAKQFKVSAARVKDCTATKTSKK